MNTLPPRTNRERLTEIHRDLVVLAVGAKRTPPLGVGAVAAGNIAAAATLLEALIDVDENEQALTVVANASVE